VALKQGGKTQRRIQNRFAFFRVAGVRHVLPGKNSIPLNQAEFQGFESLSFPLRNWKSMSANLFEPSALDIHLPGIEIRFSGISLITEIILD
jgi:hypothetical protein